MNTLAVFLILISSIIHTYWNYVLKKSINKGADPVLLHWLSGIMSVILYSLVFLFFVSSYTVTSHGVFLSALCGLFIAVYVFFLSKSYAYGDLSQVYPLAKTTPFFTLLIGLFYLTETVSFIALTGIILILLGAYLIHLKNFGFKSISKPIISLKQKASIFALITAMISAFYGLFSKLGVVEINPFIFVYLTYVFSAIFYTPLLRFRTKGIIPQFKKFKKSILRIGLSDLFAYSLVVFALSLGKLSYVFALRQMSILFSVFVGIYELKEGYGKTRIVASIIIVAGIMLISISR